MKSFKKDGAPNIKSPVAKFLNDVTKPATHRDRKNDYNRKSKHRNRSED